MRTLTRTAFNEYAPVVLLDDPIRQREAETRSLAAFLRSKERIVNPGDVLRSNAYPCVSEIDNQRSIDGTSVHSKPAAVGHRIARVQYKVHKDLLKLRRAAVCRLKMLAIGAGDFERRTSQLRLQQLKRVVKYSIDIDLTELSIASAGEVQ